MSLHALTQRMRDFVTHPRRQDGLLRDRAAWLQLTTALDLIEDTELAIDAYRRGEDDSSGDLYLQIFGVLQAVFVQQDAITHLAEAFHVDLEAHPRLKEIRDVRNDVAGHPTSRRMGESFHALVRIQMRRNAAKVASWYRDGRMETRSIDVFELLDDQHDLARGLLDDVLDELERRDEDYKAMHRDRNLRALLPRDLDYGIEKIAAVTGFDEGRQPLGGVDGTLALGGLDAFRNAIARLDEELDRRDLTRKTYDDVDYDLRWMDHCVEQLDRYLLQAPGGVDAPTAYVYCSFLDRRLDHLREILQEIDADFGS